MSGVLRFDQLEPTRQALIQKNLATLEQKGASPDEIESYLRDDEKLAPAPHLGNAAGMLSGAAQGATFGFADEALGGIDAANALLPKALGGKGIPLSQFGQQYRATRDMIRGADKQYGSEHPVLHTGAELAGGIATALGSGGAQALKEAPTLGSKLLSALDQGIVGGAVSGLGSAEGSAPNQVDNAARGGMTGAVIAPAMTLAGAGAGAFGKTALNKLNLRPGEPLTVGGVRVPINTVDEEAAQKVAGAVAKSGKALPRVPQPPAPAPKPSFIDRLLSDPSEGKGQPKTFDQNKAYQTLMAAGGNPGPALDVAPSGALPPGKPQTLMELGGQPVARLARTARSASPAAGQKIDAMLTQRTAGAPDRAIDDALEASGLQQRSSAFKTANDLIEQRSADAQKAYGEAFKDAQPITDPRIQQVLKTDVGKKAWGRAQRTMSNLGMETPTVASEAPPPAGVSPEDWANSLRLASERNAKAMAPQEVAIKGTAAAGRKQDFTKLGTDDLLSLLRDEQGVLEAGANKPQSWTRFDDDIQSQVSGNTLGGAIGRQQAGYANNRLSAIEAELKSRGVDEDLIQEMRFSSPDAPLTRTIPGAKNPPFEIPTGPQVQAPSLQQLHYLKLAMDDLMEPGLNRGAGEGGIGRSEGRSILGVQKKLLSAMDDASPTYKAARQQFADQSALVKANETGRQLFKLSPEEAAAEYGKLATPAEKDVFRRAGMDALADRLENGPANPEQSIAKPREQRRIRLLFPDDASFQQFRDRIAQEAGMVGTHRFVSGGSQTADKLADLSDMLGLSTVAKAATGNLSGAAGDVAKGLMRMRGQSYGSRLGESIADMTTAGGNGDRNELARAIQRLQATRPKPSRGSVAPLVTGDIAGLKGPGA